MDVRLGEVFLHFSVLTIHAAAPKEGKPVPSLLLKAARPERSPSPLYWRISSHNLESELVETPIATGEFGADYEVALVQSMRR